RIAGDGLRGGGQGPLVSLSGSGAAAQTGVVCLVKQKWADLFHSDFEVLLYDLTSTYFEGEMEQNPKAKRGYSRDKRPDCLQLVIAWVATTDGLPLAYEVMKGNTSDRTTLPGFLEKIENTYGKARRVWVMDRGVPSEAILKDMREPERQTFYLVGTPKSRIDQHEKKWLDLPWQKVRDSVEVKLYEQRANSACWPRAAGGRLKRTPCGASGWLACCANCGRCARACRSAINCCCASAPLRKKPAGLSGL